MRWDYAVSPEAAQRLLALRGVRHLELDIGDARLLLELFRPVIGRLVERLVELAAEIVKQRRLDIGGKGRKRHGGCGQKAQNDTFHVIHTLSIVLFGSVSVLRRTPPWRPACGFRQEFRPPARGLSCMATNKIHPEF